MKTLWVCALVVAGLGSVTALAARAGRVDIDDTPLYEGPGKGYRLIEKLPKRTPIAASNLPIEGFFKIRTPQGTVGWASGDALVLQPAPPPPDEGAVANAEGAPPPSAYAGQGPDAGSGDGAYRNRRRRNFLIVRALGGGSVFDFTGVIQNFGGPQFAGHLGGELAFRLSNDFNVLVRGEFLFKNLVLNGSSNFQVDLTSLPVMIGTELILFNSGKFSSRLGALGGIALSTTVVNTVLTPAAPQAYATSNAFVGLGKIDLNFQFLRWLSVYGEAAFRFLRTVPLTPNVSNAASAILQSQFALDFTGAEFTLGITISAF